MEGEAESHQGGVHESAPAAAAALTAFVRLLLRDDRWHLGSSDAPQPPLQNPSSYIASGFLGDCELVIVSPKLLHLIHRSVLGAFDSHLALSVPADLP